MPDTQQDRERIAQLASSPVTKTQVTIMWVSAAVTAVAALISSLLNQSALMVGMAFVAIAAVNVSLRYAAIDPMARELRRLREELERVQQPAPSE